MALSASQMARLSRLLDEALPLDGEGRRCWLQALPSEHRDLAEALERALVPQSADVGRAQVLDTLPKIGGADVTAPVRSDLQPGQLVGPYRLVRELGAGGMAEVWLAQRADGAYRRDVALKLPMLSRLRKDLARRFARERDILADLEHPNIARLYDAGFSDAGLPYLAMEYVHGEPLTAWCDAHRLSLGERLKLFLQVLEAVSYAHGHHVIHRDIKPSNILVTGDGQVRLLDFGVAKLLAEEEDHTQLTQVYGGALTPEYASPELIGGGPLEAGADIYALGVVLYELLSGRRPYRIEPGGSLAGLQRAVAEVHIEPPSTQTAAEAGDARGATPQKLARQLRGDLDAIVLKSLAKQPEDRYGSATALAEDVRRYLEGRPVAARPARLVYRLAKFVQRHPVAVPAGAAVALVIATLSLQLLQQPASIRAPATSAASSLAGIVPATGVTDKSIAVLPFVNMSSDKEQEYFSDGLAEEVLDLLAKLPQLHVIARTSSFSFKGKSDDIATIARKLNVAHILEGGVRKSGDRLRVTTQLIRADTGEQIWSETYDRELKDVFKLQDEIAAAVVEALKVRLLSQPLPSLNRTTNTEAFTRYLLGRQFRNRLDFRFAVNAYRKAIELDPNFADAWAELSVAEFWEADARGDNAGYDRALASAQKAVTLAPERAEGYWARGFLRFVVSWDWEGAQADLAKTLALDPDDSMARRDYANLLADLGRLPEAIAAARRATELDPLSAWTWGMLARVLTVHRDFTGAREAALRAAEITPGSWALITRLCEIQLAQGNASEALATCRKIPLDPEIAQSYRLTYSAMAEHSLGHVRESQQALDALIARHSHDAAYEIAGVYAWRGEKDNAFEWLERAYRQRDSSLSDVKFEPFFQSLHGDPRFAAFLAKMKLPV